MLKKIIITFIWLLFSYLLLWDGIIYILSSNNIKYLGMNKDIIELFLKYVIFLASAILYKYMIERRVKYKMLNISIYIVMIMVGLGLLNKGDNPDRIQTIGITNRTSEIKGIFINKIYFADDELNYQINPGEKIQFRILSSPVSKVDNNMLRIQTINNGKIDTFYETKIEKLLQGNSPETELFIEK